MKTYCSQNIQAVPKRVPLINLNNCENILYIHICITDEGLCRNVYKVVFSEFIYFS